MGGYVITARTHDKDVALRFKQARRLCSKLSYTFEYREVKQYFNEPGLEKQKGSQQGSTNSIMFNKMVVLMLMQSPTKLIQYPPLVFEDAIIIQHSSTLINTLCHQVHQLLWKKLLHSIFGLNQRIYYISHRQSRLINLKFSSCFKFCYRTSFYKWFQRKYDKKCRFCLQLDEKLTTTLGRGFYIKKSHPL